MNLNEGTRRLALLLGVVGVILGGLASYFQLQSTMRQRGNHQRFEELANSQVTSVERKCILGIVGEQGCREPGNNPYPNTTRVSLPNGEVRDYPNEMSEEQIEAALRKEFPSGNIAKNAKFDPYAAIAEPKDWEDVDPKTLKPIKKKVYLDDNGNPISQSSASSPTSGYIPDASTVNKDGIAVIRWTKLLAVASIETQDGQTLYPTPAPGAWSYVAIALLPLLGFFIPWGAVRAIGWVGAGFAENSK
jgi:hypothetical protein